MSSCIDYGNGIYALDAGYGRDKMASIHLIVSQGRVAIVDTAHNDALPRVRAALAELGLADDAVDYVVLTHIHLDHAGGAGAFMAAFPGARLVVHPRGVRHMADPAKLWAGTVAVYGEETATRLYGRLVPVAAERIVPAAHESQIRFGERTLSFFDAPGHASHHVAILDETTGSLFTGDTFGISYREFDVASPAGVRQFAFPSSTPVQFDPMALHGSIAMIAGFEPPAVYATHFSRLSDPAGGVAEMAQTLHRLTDRFVAIAEAHGDAGEARYGRIRDDLEALLLAEGRAMGVTLPEAEMLAIYRTDIDLNAQGLCVWLDSRG